VVQVLFLIRSLNFGGSERQLVMMAAGLKASGVPVRVATFYEGGPLRDELTRHGVECRSLKKRTRWDVVGFLWRWIQMARDCRPSVLYAFLGSANLMAIMAKPWLGHAKIVWSVRASNMDLGQYGWLDRILFQLECSLARFADRIIVNSTAGRDYVAARGFPKDKMVVIPNGIDTERFRPNPSSRERMRKEWGIGGHEFLIGVVGRLDPMKDQETFVRAAGVMGRQRQDVRFVCVGNGSDERRQALERLAEGLGLGKRILWKEAISDVATVYCALDLLTLSSAFGEGFPNVVAEAMACGVPCVVTDVGDSRMIVGETGIIVPARDPAALSKAWSMVLEWNAEKRALMSRQTRERIVRHFNVDRMVEATLKELEQVAGKSLAVVGR